MSHPPFAPTPPCVLTIAGSDSCGGAGIQADLKTMQALGVHGMSVVTAVTAQNSVGVQNFWDLPPDVVAPAALFGPHRHPGAGGEDGHAGLAAASSAWSPRCSSAIPAPVVVDPVAVSKHGHSLLLEGAGDSLRDALLPLATVVTPNLDEAEQLSGTKAVDEDSMLAVARAIKALGPRYVLIKGGHLAGDPVDVLFDGERSLALRRGADRDPAHPRHRLHAGVGDRLLPGPGRGRPTAVAKARDYVTGAIRGGFPLGSGIGPVDHAWRTCAQPQRHQ